MIDFSKLDPIHTSNTPRGRLLKPFPKKVQKSTGKNNPQFSFVIKSKNKYDNEKMFKDFALTDSFDGFATNQAWEVAQTSRMSPGREKPELGKNSNTLSLEKSDNFRGKSFSEALMRKKLKSVCYTRRQRTKMQLSKCIQSLYLKVQSERLSIQTSKIKSKTKQILPFAKNLDLSPIKTYQ